MNDNIWSYHSNLPYHEGVIHFSLYMNRPQQLYNVGYIRLSV